MSNHSFHRLLGALEIDVVCLYARFTVGAAGAPTLVSAPGSKGVTSVSRTSAGLYVLTLDDGYQKLLWGAAQILDATNSDPTAVGVASKLVSNVDGANNPATVTIAFFDMATPYTAADPRNGATVLVKLEFRNSSVI